MESVPMSLEEMCIDYENEIRRCEGWKLKYQEATDSCAKVEEQLRVARNRITLLEKELERIANEGS